jgi:uncharacterized protein (TIGR03435 family)
MKSVRITPIVLRLLSTAFAQTAPPAFEVAVIRPSMPMAEAMPLLMQGRLKVGISIDKALVDMRFVTLTDLIVKAYNVKPHQIAGPDWLLMERFDIQAKLPEGGTEGQTPQMLQTMLADRFGLRTHTESRAESAYSLIVGKSGAKLEPSSVKSDAEPPNGLATMTPAAGGKLTSAGGPAGPVQMTMGPDGIRLVMLKTKVSGFADLLTSILGKPVIDRTGLSGDYQISLDLPQSDVQNVARALGMGGPGGAAGSAADPAGSSMFQAVEQLGLRLDARKEQIEKLIIDHIEKQPTGN